jgi:flagellar export protein FliJ
MPTALRGYEANRPAQSRGHGTQTLCPLPGVVVKRFEFRLQRLLHLKEQEKKLSELAVLQARTALDFVLAEKAQLLESLQQTAMALQGKVGQPVAVADWMVGQMHTGRITASLESTEQKIQKAKQQLLSAVQTQMTLARDVEALSHLRSREWKEYRRKIAAAQQDQLDEVGLRRWRPEGSTQEMRVNS